MNETKQAIIWQKFLHNNGDLTRPSMFVNIHHIKRGNKELKNTDKRIVELFTMEDTGAFLKCCLDLKEEINKL